MADPKNPVPFGQDDDFRKGACHGTAWFLQTTQTLVAEGRTAREISEHLQDLLGVVTEWRSGAGELPDGNPWDWSYRDLASVIKARKGG
jgi:hypothetical protein